jgi:hypothetical protein
MIKEIKIPPNSKPNSYLKDFPLGFGDLLEKIIVFNPNKRIKID